jgi:hypothetical protein
MSKIIKAILRVCVGIVQLAVSLVVIIALISAVNVVVNQNFATLIDTDNAEFNIANPSNSNISLPFNLDNTQGFYSLDELTISIDMNIKNNTADFNVMNGSQVFNIPAHVNFSDTLFFGNDSFTWDLDLLYGIAANPTAYNISLYVEVSARYALGLIPFTLNITSEMPLSP